MAELKTAAAAAPTTDLGEFEAIAAAWTADREKDVIRRGAFANTIKAWQASGKRIPLHWQHSATPERIIGTIDPHSMIERDDGLFVRGRVDLEGSEVARQAWRSIKSGAVGLSFGYLPTGATRRDGGGRHLTELDLFEISITAAPMHPATRILSAKAMGASARDIAQLRADVKARGRTLVIRKQVCAALADVKRREHEAQDDEATMLMAEFGLLD